MKAALLKRLDALEASLARKDRQPILLLEVDTFDPADRNVVLDGDEAVLTKYGSDPEDPSPDIRTIVISVHPERRDNSDNLRDLDDEELERVERQRERGGRRRAAEERERRQLEATQWARGQCLPAPPNAYSPEYDWE